MTPSLKRFSRGFICGSLVGAALLAFGLVGWGIAVITGLTKDDSTHGISLLPIYILAFGLGGSVVNVLDANKAKSFKSVFAWVLAVAIVLSGCSLIASFVVSAEPVEWVWGVGSGAVLLVMLTFALVLEASNKRSNAEPNAPADVGRDPGF